MVTQGEFNKRIIFKWMVGLGDITREHTEPSALSEALIIAGAVAS